MLNYTQIGDGEATPLHDKPTQADRQAPPQYEISRAGSKAFTLAIDGQAIATTVTKRDAEAIERLLKYMTKYSGRRYLREAVAVALAEPEGVATPGDGAADAN